MCDGPVCVCALARPIEVFIMLTLNSITRAQTSLAAARTVRNLSVPLENNLWAASTKSTCALYGCGGERATPAAKQSCILMLCQEFPRFLSHLTASPEHARSTYCALMLLHHLPLKRSSSNAAMVHSCTRQQHLQTLFVWLLSIELSSPFQVFRDY